MTSLVASFSYLYNESSEKLSLQFANFLTHSGMFQCLLNLKILNLFLNISNVVVTRIPQNTIRAHVNPSTPNTAKFKQFLR